MGIHSVWFTDSVFHQINILETFTLMTVAATVTSRVRLGTAVLLFVLRHPVLVAKAMATLDHLSGGRVTLGISPGGRDNEFGPMGVSMNRWVSKLAEDNRGGRAVRIHLGSDNGAAIHRLAAELE